MTVQLKTNNDPDRRDAKIQLSQYQQRFQSIIHTYLPTHEHHLGQLFEAVHYAFNIGGKRLRPALCYAVAESFGIALNKVDVLAFALECIHTYSLIHDDLPAMDNDNLRRGHPACHIQFDEATAILAGDGLQSLAFSVLANDAEESSDIRLKQIKTLAEASGVFGMVGGQDTDMFAETQQYAVTLEELQALHQQKTGQLIKAAMLMPYLSSDCYCVEKAQKLSELAEAVGLYYQIQDDILDVTQSSEQLGKPSGSDINNGKTTYVSLLGVDKAKQTLMQLERQMNTQLGELAIANSPLAAVLEMIFKRNN